ncbi:MAG TPA: DinB family protein, partial [Chitinophagales bacterium]|nr:DinB family protein [Chitinophagales bacterium]
MSATHALIKEIEQESASTIKMLERVPTDKFDWKPHEKSMTLKQLATHIAELPITIKIAATTDYLDFAEKSFSKPEINSAQDLVNLYQQ